MDKKKLYKKKIELIKSFLENNGNVNKLIELQKESLNEIKKTKTSKQSEFHGNNNIIR